MARVARDALLGVALVVGCLAISGPGDGLLWWATALIGTAGVALRRTWPVPMLAVIACAAAVRLEFVGPPTVLDLAALVALYTVAARTRRTRSLTALAVLLLAAFAWSVGPTPDAPRLTFHVVKRVDPGSAPTVTDRTPGPWSGLLVIGSALVAAWAVGSATRGRREHLAHLRERAEHLERDRDQQAALAVAAERARISREMHDVVAHGLAMIVIQAQGGAASLDTEPAATRAALEAIVSVGRASLADMRLVVGALKDDATWRPQPGLAQLPALVASVSRTGTPVRLTVVGTPAALSSTVDLSAYRIVQEALTNTMKHARSGASAEVVLTYGSGGLEIEVFDDGGPR